MGLWEDIYYVRECFVCLNVKEKDLRIDFSK